MRIRTKQNSDKVCVVSLLASPVAVEEVPGARSQVFDGLKAMLAEKYGKPTYSDTKSEGTDIEFKVVWSFPSTSITLTLSDEARHHVGYVSVEYKAVDKKALDIL